MKHQEKMTHYPSLLISIFTICLIFSSYGNIAGAGDWPHWRGPNYNGISDESGWNAEWPAGGPKVLWKASVGIGFSTVSVSDGKVFAIGNTNDKDTVFCFDAETGEEIWKHTYPQRLDAKYYEGGTLATPTVDGNKVYTVSKDGMAFCIDIETSNPVWSKNLLQELNKERATWGISGSPLIIGDLVIYNIGSSGLALNKADGSVVWQNGQGPNGYSTAVPFNNKKSIAIFGREELFGLTTEKGEQLWHHPWKTQYDIIAADPIFIDDNTVFISSGYNNGCGLLKISGSQVTEVWRNKNIRNKMNPSVIWKEYAYGVDEGGSLVCIALKDGEKKWEQKGFGQGSIAIADGKLLVMAENGNLVIAKPSPEAYTVISQAKVLSGKCWTVPVVANGRIYVRNTQGDLLCLDVKKEDAEPAMSPPPAASQEWPQWQGPNQDNKSTETGLLQQWPEAGPEMLWSAEGLGAGFSTVSIADGMIYTAGIKNNEGVLTALDLQGNIKWQKPYGAEWTRSHPGTRGTPAVNDGCVYVTSGLCAVTCFDAKTGEKKWTVDAMNDFKGKAGRWGIAQSPLVVDNKVICAPGGEEVSLVALDKKTSDVVWKAKGNGEGNYYCTPLLIEKNDKKIIVTMLDNFIIAVDAENGNIIWQYDCKNYQGKDTDVNPNTPLYQDGCLYITSGYGKGGAKLKLSDDATKVESQEWKNTVLDCHHGGVVLLDGHIYGTNHGGNWICLDWKDGSVKYDTKGIGKGSVTYGDGKLYCYDEKNATVALVEPTPEEFKAVSSFKAPLGDGDCWARPVICDGRLYIRRGDALMAYNIKAN